MIEKPRTVEYARVFSDDPHQDKTVFVVGGKIPPKELRDALRVLRGDAHAKRYPRKEVGA
jgi:hypothetical protein